MKIANQEQSEKLQQIADGLDAIGSVPSTGDPDVDRASSELRTSIHRCLSQFNSDIMVVVALGMLKAGKSTLINLLARTDKASPVGYGRDTTLRPVLVRMASPDEAGEGRITVYHSAIGGATKSEALSAIMDYIRGLSPLTKVAWRELPLTQENLRRTLCCAVAESENVLTSEPVLVVVTTPYVEQCRMLSEGRMLLDMPGLDSASADVSRMVEEYKELVCECDLMMFVQSSVAPLNEKACDVLTHILSVRESATSWIVQNMMLSKPWRSRESIEREIKSQSRYADDTFNRLQAKPSHDVQKLYVNLGMAYDGLLADAKDLNPQACLPDGTPITRENLQKVSRYDQLEGALLEDLNQNGKRSRFLHCCDELKRKLEEHRTRLKELLVQLQEAEGKAYHVSQMWNRLDTDVSNTIDDVYVALPSKVLLREMPDLLDVAEGVKEDFPGMKGNDKVPGSFLDAYLKRCSEVMHEKCCEFLQRAPIDDTDLVSSGATISGLEQCNQILKSVFDRIAQYWMTDHEYANLLRDIPSEYRPSYHLRGNQCRLELEVGDFPAVLPDDSFTEMAFKLWVIKVEKKWEPRGGNVRDCLLRMKEGYERALHDFVSEHAAQVFKRVIRAGLKEGSRVFCEQVRQHRVDAEKRYDHAREVTKSAQKMLQEVKRFISIAHEL